MKNHVKRFSFTNKEKVSATLGVVTLIITPFFISSIASAANDLQQFVVAAVTPDSAHPISDSLQVVQQKDRANVKGRAIASMGSIAKIRRGAYSIEIQRLEPIEGGVQVFARAWDANDQQIGFGTDGSVEIERFRIFNPPVMVPDGTIPVVTTSATGTDTRYQHIFREDPREALLQAVEHAIAVSNVHDARNIIKGKVGRTTDTFYSSAGATDPVDGRILRYGVNDSFASIRSGNGTYAGPSVTAAQAASLVSSATTNQYSELARGVYVFDTSAISSVDTVASATFSFTSYGKDNEGPGNPDLHIFWGATTANNDVVTGDYQNNQASGSLGSVAYTSISTDSSTYNSISLSSLANINKGTGARTKLGSGTQWDVNNSLSGYTWTSGLNSYIGVNFADINGSGTTADPKLVVVHTSIKAPTGLRVTPSFSGLFLDASSTALATHYQLQVSDYSSSGDWGSLYWDSGKQSLSSSTPINQRSPSITSTSTFSGGQTYYWRIKFWDQANNEGIWSTTSPLFMIAN
jgi:hypothetical protein